MATNIMDISKITKGPERVSVTIQMDPTTKVILKSDKFKFKSFFFQTN